MSLILDQRTIKNGPGIKGFTKKPTVDEQLNEKPATETSKSSEEQQTNG
jgi:hypothetical protein